MKRPKVKLPSNYSEETWASPYWIVRWPHQVRVRTGADLISEGHPSRVLDYGAGDGHVLATAVSRGLSAQLVAYEPWEYYAQQIPQNIPTAEVVTEREQLTGPFDVISCLSVLEHMPLNERIAFYELCVRTLSPTGRIVIDVPIETGLTLLVKAAGRRVLKGRDAEYDNRSLFRHGLGAVQYDPARFDPTSDSTWIQSHHGFDHRLLERELGSRFSITRRVRTPIERLPLATQEIFLVATRLPEDG